MSKRVQRQEMINKVPFFRSKLPEEFKAISSPEAALKAYCTDLLLQLLTPSQVQGKLLHVLNDERYLELLVTACSMELNKDKKKLFETLVFRGMGLSLQQQNLNAYFKGMGMLKDLYGVAKTYVATIQEDRPKLLSEEFMKLKAAELEQSVDPDKKE